jgi:hypothetical protein
MPKLPVDAPKAKVISIKTIGAIDVKKAKVTGENSFWLSKYSVQ